MRSAATTTSRSATPPRRRSSSNRRDRREQGRTVRAGVPLDSTARQFAYFDCATRFEYGIAGQQCTRSRQISRLHADIAAEMVAGIAGHALFPETGARADRAPAFERRARAQEREITVPEVNGETRGRVIVHQKDEIRHVALPKGFSW